MPFIHLHVHSHYSLNKAIASPDELAALAAEYEMPALALTDQDSLAGISEHLAACRRHGIKPLVGAELSVSFPTVNQTAPSIHHLTALVATESGYRNLVRLLNAGRRMRQNGKIPFAIPLADLISSLHGLIVLTGCHVSRLFHAARSRQVDEAVSHIQTLSRAAGRENVYLEILPAVRPGEEAVNRRLLELAAYAGLKPVATQNVQYLKKSHHLGLYCMQSPLINDETWGAWMQSHALRHLCNDTEMRAMFGWRPELLENTLQISDRCRFASPSEAQHFPIHILPRGEDPEAVLWQKAVAGLSKMASGPAEIRLKERLNREIARIRQAKMPPLFLLLHELAAELDRAGIVRGPAQGIWQTSATAAALGLTALDPASFHLPEPNWLEQADRYPMYRFEVAESDQLRAAEIISSRIGKFRVGRVGRWASVKRHPFLRQMGERLGVSKAKLNRLLAERPAPRKKSARSSNGNGNGHALEEGLKVTDSTFLRKAADLLAERPNALRPDGVMLAFSGQDIEDTVPLVELSDSGLTTLLDSQSLDSMGIPRVDIVSSALMTVISWTVQSIREQLDPGFGLSKIPLEDPDTFSLLAQARTNCIGELHGISCKTLLRSAPPKSLLEMAAILRRRRKGDPAAENEASADLAAVMPTALISYWAAWLKCHYPLAFMSAMLTRNVAFPKRFTILLREARREKIRILPPDLSLSRYKFIPENGCIRTGLIVVKQLGEKSYEELETERRGGPFEDLVDFCRRMDPKSYTNRLVSNLVKVGAMDRFNLPRSHHLAMVDDVFRDLKAEREHTDDLKQPTLFDMAELELKRPGSDVRLDEVPELDMEQLLLNEREAAGYVISADPFKIYDLLIRQLKARSPFELRRRNVGDQMFVAGYIDHVEWDGAIMGDQAVALLDCEGAVVRVGRGARSFIGADLECAGPALMHGIVRRNKEEIYLEADEVFSLEEVYLLSKKVAMIELDVGGVDTRDVKELIALVKAFSGESRISVAFGALGQPPVARKLHGLRTFFCPPVYLGLIKKLTRDRVILQAADGSTLEVPPPAIIA